MSPAPKSVVTPGQFLSILWRHPRRWLVPALAVALLAALYALVRPDQWEASQALIVRNEAANNGDRPGKFIHSDEMKTAQETILQLAKSRGVLAAALTEAGPAGSGKPAGGAWPSDRDVAALRNVLNISPPQGAEFGTTEVFYVQVRDGSRDRAVALVAAVCDRLETRYQQIRDAKAQSMISELAKAVQLARDDMAESTVRLTTIEKQVGSDLAELRSLQAGGGGESALRRTVAEIRNELRGAQAAESSSRELLALLQSAQADPNGLLATPNRLLESQPAIRRLKEGLVDAQLRTAELSGRMSDRHPLVQAAKESEHQIGRHLHNELSTAIRGIQVDLDLNADRVVTLQGQLDAATERLDRLAGLRAPYANLVAQTGNRGELLKAAEQRLADARVAQAGAKAASLIGRIDAPDAGIHPVGPGRLMIVLVGLAGGLLAGLGTLLLTVELVQPAPASPEATAPQPSPRAHEGNGHTPAKPQPAGVLSFKEALQRIAANRSNGR